MNERSVPSARFARAAALTAVCCMLGSGYVLAATGVFVRGLASAGAQAPTDAFCRANFDSPCYSPQEIRTAYGFDRLIDAGMVGAGQTIVIIESYGSPTLAADLMAFDEGYGLPPPPSLTVLAPLGTVPFNPTAIPDQIGWAFETSLDVEWAHANAPGAAIVVLTSPVDETEGVQGLPEFLYLEQYALDHHLGKIISQSWAATENTLFASVAGPQGPQVIADFSAFYARAARENVTVLASAGDTGSANDNTAEAFPGYPFPTVNFPASSPLVTAVGGTSLYADTSGNYQSETVWNNSTGAGGGGISQILQEPIYQRLSLHKTDRTELNGKRGLPDVSYNADPLTPILVYASFYAAGGVGYYFIGGTSEGAPSWAGIVADLNQYAGRPLGFLNPVLYAVGGLGLWRQVGRDITVGNNAFAGVPGYSATLGWDPASGWGTPNLVELPSHASVLLER